jgi:DNA polymerase III delta prime subunit
MQQPRAVDFLIQALTHDRLSHAYIVRGTPVGAQPLVQALAVALFCPQGGCQHCSVCEQVVTETYPDLFTLRAAEDSKSGIIRLKQIEALVQKTLLPPVQSRLQVFVIENAEAMNTEASNALLKTLEEPSTQSLFLLVTPHVQRLLPTIRSRAQILPMNTEVQHADQAGFLQWADMAQVRHEEQKQAIISQLLTRNQQDLILQLQLLQRACWQEALVHFRAQPSQRTLVYAQQLLQLFDTASEQLLAHGNTKLVVDFFCHDFFRLRGVRSR